VAFPRTFDSSPKYLPGYTAVVPLGQQRFLHIILYCEEYNEFLVARGRPFSYLSHPPTSQHDQADPNCRVSVWSTDQNSYSLTVRTTRVLRLPLAFDINRMLFDQIGEKQKAQSIFYRGFIDTWNRAG
jgi:hypothetical protein